MVAAKEIEADWHSPTKPKVFRLPDATAIKELRMKHEMLCGDLYVAYHLTGQLDWWEAVEDYDAFGLKPDRQMIWNGRIVFWEVDRGTEDYHTEAGIKGKLDRYLALSKSRAERRFNVCFTTVDQKDIKEKTKRTAEARARGILRVIDQYERGDQFMVTFHRWAVEFPENPCWMTYKHPEGVALRSAT